MREILDLYALYKQAKVGDCNTPRPRYPDFKGISQWDAWKSKEGIIFIAYQLRHSLITIVQCTLTD